MIRRRVLAITIAIVAISGVSLLLLAAAPAAPRWPAASLDYYTAASEQLEVIREQSGIAFQSAGKPDSAETISDTVTAVTAAVEAINELEPPVPLLAFHQQAQYAAGTCNSAVGSARTVQFDGLAAVGSAPIYVQFVLECARSINEAKVEGARYASTVGGFPEEE